MRMLARLLSAFLVVGTIAAASLPERAAAQDTSSALQEIQKRGYIRVGWATWYPFAYKDPKTGQVTGLTADLMKDVGEWLKVEVRWVEDGWGTMIAGLQANKYDIAMPMAITLPRALAVTFTEPFMQFNLGVMVRKEDDGKYKSWQELDKPGMKVVAALGSNTALYAKKVFRNATIIEAKSEPDSVTSVLTRKADAWASSYSTFQAPEAPGRDQMVIVPGAPFAYSPMSLVVRQGDFLMRDWLNAFQREERISGALMQIIEKNNLDESYVMK
jgi:cyclohexadienyl dehydratase